MSASSALPSIDFIQLVADRVVEKIKPEILAALRDLAPQKPNNSGPLLYSFKQAGALLSVSGMTIARFAKKGTIKTVALGARKLIPAVELDRLVNDLMDKKGRH